MHFSLLGFTSRSPSNWLRYRIDIGASCWCRSGDWSPIKLEGKSRNQKHTHTYIYKRETDHNLCILAWLPPLTIPLLHHAILSYDPPRWGYASPTTLHLPPPFKWYHRFPRRLEQCPKIVDHFLILSSSYKTVDNASHINISPMFGC